MLQSNPTKKITQPIKEQLHHVMSSNELLMKFNSSIELGRCYNVPILYSLNKYSIFLDFIPKTSKYCLQSIYVCDDFDLNQFSWSNYLMNNDSIEITSEVLVQVVGDLYKKLGERNATEN
jgi:hypothetical protein